MNNLLQMWRMLYTFLFDMPDNYLHRRQNMFHCHMLNIEMILLCYYIFLQGMLCMR